MAEITDLPMQLKKSEQIPKTEIEKELINLWTFNPYKIITEAAALNRYANSVEWECKNCNYKFASTFANLEMMHDKNGWYCPKCHGVHNPVFESKLPEEFEEQNPKYIPLLIGEYAIMSAINEYYGYKPYNFISIDTKRTVTLEHKCCSTKFTATPTMLFENNTFTDKFSNESLKLPYCPRCNSILINEGMNYGGTRFVENLHNFFEDSGKEFPYEFAEDDLYRFRSYDSPLITTCKYCGQTFSAKPEDLFDNRYESHCPYCKGIPMKTDSAERTIQEQEIVDKFVKEQEQVIPDQGQNLSQESIIPESSIQTELLEQQSDTMIEEESSIPDKTSIEIPSPDDMSQNETISLELEESIIPPVTSIPVSEITLDDLNAADSLPIIPLPITDEFYDDIPTEEIVEEEFIEPQINSDGYTDSYQPQDVVQEAPDFANPEIVDMEFETDPLLQDPTEETQEEYDASMAEIISATGNNDIPVDDIPTEEIVEEDVDPDTAIPDDISLEDENIFTETLPEVASQIDAVLQNDQLQSQWPTNQPVEPEPYIPSQIPERQSINRVDIISIPKENIIRPISIQTGTNEQPWGKRPRDAQDDLIDADILATMS